MNRISHLLFIIFLSFLFINNCFSNQETKKMFNHPVPPPAVYLKNLNNISFAEKDSVEKIIDQLAKFAKDPYAASLPMMMSAQLGDQKRYEETRRIFVSQLSTPANYPAWTQKSLNSFKAWMWGRALLAADDMSDEKSVGEAQKELSILLVPEKQDNLAFFTWAEGYSAALNKKEFDREAKSMINNTDQLIAQYKTNKSNHDALSNALWACVMVLQAAANAKDQATYQQIKEKIIALTGEKTVTDALDKGLLRNASSNDYPAWAMAIAKKSAAAMRDKELYVELSDALARSVTAAKIFGADAEYGLAVLNNQLALEIGTQKIDLKKSQTLASGL